MKVLESLIEMIREFPYDDPTYAKLHDDLDRIRGRFKQVCPLCSLGGSAFLSRAPWALGAPSADGLGLRVQVVLCVDIKTRQSLARRCEACRRLGRRQGKLQLEREVGSSL